MTPERIAQLEQLGTTRGQGLAMIAVHVELCTAVRELMGERDAAREGRYFARVEVDELRRDMAALTRWADGEEREDVPVDEIHDVLRKPRWYAANPATTAEPAAEQDNESLFESHRLADGTMPDTIPVTDPEQDAPDGATVDGYTRQRDTWVKSAEPAAS